MKAIIAACKSFDASVITLFAIVFDQWTKLFERPMYHGHREPMPLIWRVFNSCQFLLSNRFLQTRLQKGLVPWQTISLVEANLYIYSVLPNRRRHCCWQDNIERCWAESGNCNILIKLRPAAFNIALPTAMQCTEWVPITGYINSYRTMNGASSWRQGDQAEVS